MPLLMIFFVEKLDIAGMSCTSCAKRIENTLQKVEGVTRAKVNFATEQLHLDYHSSQISISTVLEQIQKIGFQVAIVNLRSYFQDLLSLGLFDSL